MNAQESREFVRRKCIDANPDILKLKFGCRIKVNLTEGGGTIATVVGEDRNFVFWTWAELHENKNFVGSELKERVEIIGRPIQLADVLLALDKSVYGCEVAIQVDGSFLNLPEKTYDTPNLEFKSTTIKWNLLKSFDDQSDETVIKIAEMMKWKY